jgi:hypothetical protein
MKRIAKFLCIAVCLSGMCICQSHGDIIYDVSFEDPPHVVDSPVVIGSGTDRPTGTQGDTMIRVGIGDFASQVAVIGPSSASIMAFSPGTIFSSGLVSLSWDLAMLSMSAGLYQAGVSFEPDSALGGGPLIVNFLNSNTIQVQTPSANVTNIATFTLGQQDSFAVSIDLDADLYSISVNGLPQIQDDSMGSAWNLQSVVFYGGFLQTPEYAVDNFLWQTIPEPSTCLLMLLAGIALRCRRISDHWKKRR